MAKKEGTLYNLRCKLKESLFSVFPVALIVLAVSLIFIDAPGALLVKFSISSVLLFFGIALFSLGADQSMIPIGRNIASTLTKSKKIWLLCIACLVMGVIITIAEPDLAVLAGQIPAFNKWMFIGVVSAGVGVCFLLGALRILFKIPLAYLLSAGYAIIFFLMIFVPKSFWAVSFDASGVTTGAISVPFIMAFCLGISAVRSGASSEEDSFGLVAICSMGPVLSVLLMGLFSKNVSVSETIAPVIDSSYGSIPKEFGSALLNSFKEVALVILPIIVVFFIFQFTMMKLPKKQLIKILIGLLYTYFGVVVFMTGVNVGFSDLGYLIGHDLMLSKYSWIIYPIALVLGFVVVLAEPAVHVLTKQVSDISGNTISKKVLLMSLAIGVAISLTLAVVKSVFAVNIMYFMLPMFVISLALSFYNPRLFTAVAFDAGGIASGPMSATFLLPLISGVTIATGGDVMMGAFGTVALIATTPILVIQILGAIAKTTRIIRTKKQYVPASTEEITVVEYDY